MHATEVNEKKKDHNLKMHMKLYMGEFGVRKNKMGEMIQSYCNLKNERSN